MSYSKGSSAGSRNTKDDQSRYQRQMKQPQTSSRLQGQVVRTAGKKANKTRQRQRQEGDAIDEKFGFERLKQVL